MIRKTYLSLLLMVAGGIVLSAQGGYEVSERLSMNTALS